MACPFCSAAMPENAKFCPQCGQFVAKTTMPPNEDSAAGGFQSGFGTFALTLAGSLLLSAILMVVFHLPVLILGAVLPLFWLRPRGR